MMSPLQWLMLLCAVIAVQGSVIHLNSTSTTLKPPLTENFSLRCALQDTANTVSGSGNIIGRKRREVIGSSSHVTESTNQNKPNKRKIGVTNTSTNADFVTSIVVSKDGANLAAISEHVPVRAIVNSPTFTVTGSLTEKSGERGFLQLTWPNPTQADSGSYRCDIDAVDLSGGSFDFAQTEQINSEEVAFSDLVDYVQALAREKDLILLSEKSTNETLKAMKKSEESMNATINDLNNQIQLLKQQNHGLASQLNKTSTRIFFSAGCDNHQTLSLGDVLVFNQVWSNVGGAYQSGTGVFTCPIPGFYAFSYNVGSDHSKNAAFNLYHNNQKINEAFSEGGNGYRSASNEVILKLGVNDTVKIVARYTSYVFSSSTYLTTTFSGELIKID